MSAELLLARRGQSLLMTLNRPKALNALTQDMCGEVNRVLKETDARFLVMKGAGGRAFCAGGDVKACYQSILDSKTDVGTGKTGIISHDFFREEYIMNNRLGQRRIPQVSLWSGFVMGGGVGISVLGQFRVATNNTIFAMPETNIGLFPDVGSTSWLANLPFQSTASTSSTTTGERIPPGLGLYVGLNGTQLAAHDICYAGLATHFCDQSLWEQLEETLLNLHTIPGEEAKKIQEVLDDFDFRSRHNKPTAEQSKLHKHADLISKVYFGKSTDGRKAISQEWRLEQIVQQLRSEAASNNNSADERAFLNTSLQEISRMSPTSLKVTWEGLRRGQELAAANNNNNNNNTTSFSSSLLSSCLIMEYRMMMGCMRSYDFLEGIRAALVDKDKNPQWQPKTLEEVEEATVQSYFQPLGSYDLTFDE